MDALQRMQVARVVVEVDPDREEEAKKSVSKVADLLKRAHEEARAYEALAREAVGKLIGPEGPMQNVGSGGVTAPAPP